MTTQTMDSLRSKVNGPVIGPADPAFEDVRKVYNFMIDRRPAAIVRCQTADDVVAVVRHATDAGAELAVRGGAHSVPGFGTADGAIVIDLAQLSAVSVNPTNRTATVGGGATWGGFNDAAAAHGLATTGGIVSTTGVGGLTLGGGIGYLARGYGLSCDNLLSAQVVTAAGEILTVSAEENADLFWAIRGGGGNFGIVTEFTFRMHPVAQIYGGPMFFELADGPAVLAHFDEFIRTAPREYGGFPGFHLAPPLPFVPEDRVGDPLVAVVSCWTGSMADGEKIVASLREVARPVAEHVGPMPYAALNSAFDALVPRGLQHYWKAAYIRDLPAEAIDIHLRHGALVPNVSCAVHLYPVNGACHDVGAAETAFGHRDATYAAVIAGMWPDAVENDANIRWVKDYYAAITPHTLAGGYVNFASADDQSKVAENYGSNFARLREVKRRYDPSNVFHHNQNIEP